MSKLHRFRTLLAIRNLPPIADGMERLNWRMADEASKVAEVCVIAPVGCSALAAAFFLLGCANYALTFVQEGCLTNGSTLLWSAGVIAFLIGLISEQITSLIYRQSQ